MPETTNQPTADIPVQTADVSQTGGPLPPKRKFSPIWILLFILILAAAGGVYYYFNYFNLGQTVAPSFSPSESPELTLPPSKVSSSTDINTLEKELDDTDLGSFETDLNQLDTEAGQL